MNRLFILLLPFVLLKFAMGQPDQNSDNQRIRLLMNCSDTTVSGTISGYQFTDYQCDVKDGQSLTIDFSTDNPAAYFNLLPPYSEAAVFIGSVSGNQFESKGLTNGQYTTRVYMMRSAARRNESADYSLRIKRSDPDETQTVTVNKANDRSLIYQISLKLQGITFDIRFESDSLLHIKTTGLEIDNKPIIRRIDGVVTGAEIGDVNADGSPEIYIYINSADSISTGFLVAYSANNRKSLSEIYLPPLSENKSAIIGYRGHDEFTVLENVIGRRYPIYTDTYDNMTQGTPRFRQIQYRLTRGEAGWILKIDTIIEY